MLLAARLANLLLGVGLILLIGWWAWRIWGSSAALLAIALAAFEPNFVAHASLVTTDIGATLFSLLTLYLLWECFNLRNPRLLIGAGLALGAALVSKFSTVILLAIGGALILPAPFFDPALGFFAGAQNRPAYRLLDAAAALLLVSVCAALVIPAAYFFHGFEPWLSGLQRFVTLAHEGQPTFFLGRYSSQGWWNYYLVAYLIKTPLGSMLLIAAALLFHQNGNRLRARESIFLLLPVLVILLATTQASVNIGLRHILPVYPFLFVIASRLATIQFQRRWLAPALISGALPRRRSRLCASRRTSLPISTKSSAVQAKAINIWRIRISIGARISRISKRTWTWRSCRSCTCPTSARHHLLIAAFATNTCRGPGRSNGRRLPTEFPQQCGEKFSRSAFTICRTLPIRTSHSFAGYGIANRRPRTDIPFLSTI